MLLADPKAGQQRRDVRLSRNLAERLSRACAGFVAPDRSKTPPLAWSWMMDDFATAEIQTGETPIFVRYCGSGPPILLLHGFPQST